MELRFVKTRFRPGYFFYEGRWLVDRRVLPDRRVNAEETRKHASKRQMVRRAADRAMISFVTYHGPVAPVQLVTGSPAGFEAFEWELVMESLRRARRKLRPDRRDFPAPVHHRAVSTN